MEDECPNKSVLIELTKLDTCKWSVLHHLFTHPPIQETTFLKSYLIPWIITAFLFYGIPLVAVLIRVPDNLFTDQTSGVKIGFLNDWCTMFMFLITLPVIVILTLSQRSMVPGRIYSILGENPTAVRESGNSIGSFVSSWNERFKIINLLAQFAGLLVAIAVFGANYLAESKADYNSWEAIGGNINVAGWMYLCWQLPVFYWIASIFIIQELALIFLLFGLTRNFEIKVSPFHHDNCCGLKAVGRIGLRNQYLLAVAGMNLLALIAVNLQREYSGTAHLIVAAGLAYAVFGPVVFLGPLLPFRKSMFSMKKEEQAKVAKRFQTEYKRIMKTLDNCSMTKEDEELIDRLQKLRTIINRIPVWPFDTSTLRRFFTAFVLPFLTAFVSILINYLVGILRPMFTS